MYVSVLEGVNQKVVVHDKKLFCAVLASNRIPPGSFTLLQHLQVQPREMQHRTDAFASVLSFTTGTSSCITSLREHHISLDDDCR
jgi:hypothetical protein